MRRAFPGWWEVKDRQKAEARMLTLDDHAIRYQRQASLMEIYGKVGYAEKEKKALWDLVGHGNAYVDCGAIRAKGCDHVEDHQAHGKVFGRYYKRTCRRKSCPTCYESWASIEGERSVIRMASFLLGSAHTQSVIGTVKKQFATEPPKILHIALVSELEEQIGEGNRLKPIHVVLSPDPGLISEDVESYLKARAKAYRIAKQSGIFGGALVFHPYRLKCHICGSAIPDYEKECPKCHVSEFRWYWSPHFHLVGFGWVHSTAEGYSEHGWIVKNLGVRKSIFWTFQYLLSHAGDSVFHTVTWFGRLSYNVLRHVAQLGCVLEICPYCRRPLMSLEWIGLEEPPPIEFDERDPYKNQFLGEITSWRHLSRARDDRRYLH